MLYVCKTETTNAHVMSLWPSFKYWSGLLLFNNYHNLKSTDVFWNAYDVLNFKV